MRRDEYTEDGQFEHDHQIFDRSVSKIIACHRVMVEQAEYGRANYSALEPNIKQLVDFLAFVAGSYVTPINDGIQYRRHLEADWPEVQAIRKIFRARTNEDIERRIHAAEVAPATAFLQRSARFTSSRLHDSIFVRPTGPAAPFVKRFGAALVDLDEANLRHFHRDITDPNDSDPATPEAGRAFFGEFVLAIESIAESLAHDLLRSTFERGFSGAYRLTVTDGNVYRFPTERARRPEPDNDGGPGGLAG